MFRITLPFSFIDKNYIKNVFINSESNSGKVFDLIYPWNSLTNSFLGQYRIHSFDNGGDTKLFSTSDEYIPDEIFCTTIGRWK